jgi:prepilin-type N-terminal cleavage/methylation domain-containing protein
MPATTFQVRARQSTRRRGITLIELLIVMVIISIVTAASIPMLATGSDQRRVREAARLVSSYISAAKSRAIETGRPAGVMIQRFAGQNYSMALVGVEVPPPYSGDYVNSGAFIGTVATGTAIIGLGTPGNHANPLAGATPSAGTSDSGWQSLVRIGDIIQFGGQGRSYMLLGSTLPPTVVGQTPILGTTAGQLLSSVSPATACYLWATDGSLSTPSATVWTTTFTVPSGTPTATNLAVGLPYQIFRQPVKSAAQPLQMPGDTVIDLMESGVGVGGTFVGGVYANPTFLFGPTGAVGFAYYNTNPPQHLTSTLYLLIGRREGMEDLGLASTSFNINHHSCMWVAVGPQSGLVVTTENMVEPSGVTQTLAYARQYAQAASSIGGR